MDPVTIFTTITAALRTVDHGVKLAQRLGRAKDDKIVEHGEQLLEMRAALLEAKSALLDSQAVLKEREQEVAQLKEAFEVKGKVVKCGDAFYFASEDGNPGGDPFCLRCYQEDQKLRYLAREKGMPKVYVCPVCKRDYSWRFVHLRED